MDLENWIGSPRRYTGVGGKRATTRKVSMPADETVQSTGLKLADPPAEHTRLKMTQEVAGESRFLLQKTV